MVARHLEAKMMTRVGNMPTRPGAGASRDDQGTPGKRRRLRERRRRPTPSRSSLDRELADRPLANERNPFGDREHDPCVIVDDHKFLRTTVASILGDAEGIVVVGECADGTEVPDKVDATSPDVVLMDVTMPIVQGPDATRALLLDHPEVRVLMLPASVPRTPPDDHKDRRITGPAQNLITWGW
jgi:CheY-like chemotaxis protein